MIMTTRAAVFSSLIRQQIPDSAHKENDQGGGLFIGRQTFSPSTIRTWGIICWLRGLAPLDGVTYRSSKSASAVKAEGPRWLISLWLRSLNKTEKREKSGISIDAARAVCSAQHGQHS